MRTNQLPFFGAIVLLGLSCVLSVALAIIRLHFSLSASYLFLIWNLFLAMIPVILAFLMFLIYSHTEKTGLVFFLLTLLWLLFLPNAPYIITDFLHLRLRPRIPLWFDTILLFSFSWNGFLGGLVSLRLMQLLYEQRFGATGGWVFVIISCPLAALGIFVGRFLRWNSWDIFRRPRTLFADVLEQIQRPTSLDDEFAVVLILTPLLFLAYVSLLAFGKISESRS
ncbi:MAG: DUF1361 domain-containing protein [Spirochaetia bacterium]|nr:DUF1361 domain-containing protein [Spirochaetia bacterium]